MGPSLNSILNIGVSSLRAQQSAISITSHNIANVNTEGYTRQRANFAEEIPLTTTQGTFGMGVRLASIQRLRQNLLDSSYRTAAGQQGKYDMAGANAQALQSVLGDINGTNIGTALTDFFNSWHDLTNGPEDMAVRQNVIDNATVLTNFFQDASQQLSSLSGQLDLQTNATATDINTITQQVASLNTSINLAQASGGSASDLLDQRDQMLDKLSSYMNLTITDTGNGMVDVSANGEALVTGQNSFAVQVVSSGSPAHPEILSSNGNALTTGSGMLGGLTQAYQDLDSTQATVDGLASTLITEVNNIHTAGSDLNGNAGIAFFTGTDAASIAVDSTISTDPTRVAAATTANVGNGDAALQIAQLQNALVFPPGVATLNDAFRNLQVRLGSTTQVANQLAGTAKTTLENFQSQRQAANGVSTDEELSNLISYQHAYQAAARVVTMADEAMDLIINHMGRVGL